MDVPMSGIVGDFGTLQSLEFSNHWVNSLQIKLIGNVQVACWCKALGHGCCCTQFWFTWPSETLWWSVFKDPNTSLLSIIMLWWWNKLCMRICRIAPGHRKINFISKLRFNIFHDLYWRPTYWKWMVVCFRSHVRKSLLTDMEFDMNFIWRHLTTIGYIANVHKVVQKSTMLLYIFILWTRRDFAGKNISHCTFYSWHSYADVSLTQRL